MTTSQGNGFGTQSIVLFLSSSGHLGGLRMARVRYEGEA